MTQRYATPLAFKAALEARLRQRARDQQRDVNRLRQLFVMERFLVRLLQTLPESAVLKGGLALELRLQQARTTKDLDLAIQGSRQTTHEALVAAGALRLPDHLGYTVQLDPRADTITADGLAYEGVRFRVGARLAGRPFGTSFRVDASLGEPQVGTPEPVRGDDLLDFVGLEPVAYPTTPLLTHIAEKLHAYTVPRPRPNSRIKDLPDMALLAQVREVAAAGLRSAIAETFGHRDTHLVPPSLPPPPAQWSAKYERMAREDRLPWLDLRTVHAAAAAFLDPVLAGERGRWQPETAAWVPEASASSPA